MAMKIEDPQTIKLIPHFMRADSADQAIAQAIDTIIKVPGAKVKTLRVWDQIDRLDDAMLDELAWELDVDWYEDTMPIDVKRETIKTAQLIKEHRGTKWAVEQVAINSFGDATVLEWYEYGGRPYHFKVSTSYPLDTQALIDKFRKQVNYAKRASAIFDEVEFYYNGELTTYMFAGVLGYSIVSSATAT